jgi:hypothetical protein
MTLVLIRENYTGRAFMGNRLRDRGTGTRARI